MELEFQNMFDENELQGLKKRIRKKYCFSKEALICLNSRKIASQSEFDGWASIGSCVDRLEDLELSVFDNPSLEYHNRDDICLKKDMDNRNN